MDQPPRRRRIDRVSAEDLLERLPEMETERLRVLRDESRTEEERLSYTRRVVQARLDIVRAEADRRSSGEGGLLERLPTILADRPGASSSLGDTRSVHLYEPVDDEGRRRRVEDQDVGAALGTLPDLDDDELLDLAGRLTEQEHQISELRRRVLDNLDGLQAELVSRYRSGTVDVDELVGRQTETNT